MSWESVATRKCQARKDSIPAEWVIPADILPRDDQADVVNFYRTSAFFTREEREITSTTATRILSNLSSGVWTSEEVTRAFCKAAAAAQQLTNCLTEIFFDRAISRAQELDAYFRETGKTKGPFHGLPISIKDNLNVVGFDTTIGFTSLVDKPASQSSVVVDLLLEAGAVLYCKTNVSTAMMITESVNNTFGRTVNPQNRNLTTGGSSGGEAALIAFGGSRIGIGSDIGGSLRIPAACTGLFALRPSCGRLPNGLARACLEGQESVNGVIGPIASTLEEITLCSQIIIDQKPWLYDPKCLPILWRQPVELKRRLKIGVLWNDGVVKPTPPVARALEETVRRLKAAGHEIVPWKSKGHMDMLGILQQLFLADGGRSVRALLEPTGEPLRPEMQMWENAKELSVYDLWQVHRARNALAKAYLDRWNEAGIDVLLCPVTPYSGVENTKFAYSGYTCVFNLLDYPAVSFPCGVLSDKDVDTAYVDHHPFGDLDAQIQKDYSADAIHGMPVNLQLVGRKLEEESLLAITDLILKDISA
ncbi:amidase signature domain-containing protein [Aspergillus carlsbadensis]|nr:amidase signature domain-containing protein [Aspergillus carlsbadensis]